MNASTMYRILATSSMTKSISVMAQGSIDEMRAQLREYRMTYVRERNNDIFNPSLSCLERGENRATESMTVRWENNPLMWVYMILPV
jgi:hypothetical protein